MFAMNKKYENPFTSKLYNKSHINTQSNKLLPKILRALAIGVILGNLLFLLSYQIGSPLTFHSTTPNLSNITPQNLHIIRDPIKDVSNLNIPSRSLVDGESVTTLQNRFIRRPATKNCSLPPGFPGSPPGWKRLFYVCGNLQRFDLPCAPDQACIDCIPPWGGPPHLTEWANKFIKREYDTRTRRRSELQKIITNNLSLKHDESSIVLMTLNSGYTYLFLNWLCGLHLLGIADDIRLTTIIIATDEKTELLARKVGFQVVRGDWLKIKIEEKAAMSFALGAHRWTVSLQIVYSYDLIEMGYNVLQQDVDVVWFRDVRKYFENTYNDIEMACDGRLDAVGPGNTGFIHVRSNCKTKVYMETLIYYIGLVISGRSDQRVWNMFLFSYDFRQMLYEMLPPDMFVGGDQWGNGRKKGDRLSDHIWFMHASWTSDHTEKITKFKQVDAWFFNSSCPFYNDGVIPRHKDAPYYSPSGDRNWVWPDPNAKVWWKTKHQKHFYEKR
eukprot:537500_1